MKKYRKKPIVVEAEQWDKRKTYLPVAPYLGKDKLVRCKQCFYLMIDHGCLSTSEGDHIVCKNDWIIKKTKGGYHPVKPDIFGKTYEEIE